MAEEEVRLTTVITCHELEGSPGSSLRSLSLPLEVRSRPIDSDPGRATGSNLLVCDAIRHGRRNPPGPAPESISDKESTLQPQRPHSPRLSGHFCLELARQVSVPSCTTRDQNICIGHIQNDTRSQERFHHSFYYSKLDRQMSVDTAVEDLLGLPINNRLTVVDQLQLALQLVYAVLRFNKTDWLQDVWTLRDILVIHQGDLESQQHADLSISLQNPCIRDRLAPLERESLKDGEPSRASGELLLRQVRYEYGIRNVMLYSLGVALLAIGRWGSVNHGDVEAVRETAELPCLNLGNKYRELTERVLHCDFGCGMDLTDPRLENAVYESVALKLEEMIKVAS
ncbi:hypothetical protein OQA88_3197 [Cercophora sp. LCS_1]